MLAQQGLALHGIKAVEKLDTSMTRTFREVCVKLSRVINEHTAEIVAEWESFARTQLPAAAVMSDLALRNHAAYILEAIAHDIDTEQNSELEYLKSKGQAPTTAGKEESAAAVHGTLRHANGFTLIQLTAEFRALRATVMRLWLPKNNQPSEATTNDIVRFNEAIDQALADSVVSYSSRVSRARDLFLAILGHDLRAPLATMAMAGQLFKRADFDEERRREVGARVDRSAILMRDMIDDLLGYARIQLGSKIPVNPVLVACARYAKPLSKIPVRFILTAHFGSMLKVT